MKKLNYLILISIFAFNTNAADTKISELPSATSVESDDTIPIIQDGVSKQAAAGLLTTNYLPLTGGTVSGEITISNNIINILGTSGNALSLLRGTPSGVIALGISNNAATPAMVFYGTDRTSARIGVGVGGDISISGSGGNPVIKLQANTSEILFQNSNGATNWGRLRFNENGATVTTNLTAEGTLELIQVASGGTPTANSARIYSKDTAGTAEIFVMDEAGNETQISPHAMDGPEWLYDTNDPMPHVSKEVQHYLGVVRYINKSRQATLMDLQFSNPAKLNQLSAEQKKTVHIETFAEYNQRTGENLTVKDWATVQAEHQTKYNSERERELEASLIDTDVIVRAARDVKKAEPNWIKVRRESSKAK